MPGARAEAPPSAAQTGASGDPSARPSRTLTDPQRIALLEPSIRQYAHGVFVVKYILFGANILVMVGGLFLSVVGVYAKTDANTMNGLDVFPVDATLLLLLLGISAFGVSLAGCLASVREDIVLLKIFCGLVGVIFLAELGCCVAGFVFMSSLEDSISYSLKASFVDYQEKLETKRLIDVIQITYQCCGATSYNDWNANMYFECNSIAEERCGVPASCCKFRDDIQCGWGVRTTPPHLENINPQGCTTELHNLLSHSLLVVAFLAFATSFIQLLCIILAFVLIQRIQWLILLLDALNACHANFASRQTTRRASTTCVNEPTQENGNVATVRTSQSAAVFVGAGSGEIPNPITMTTVIT